MLDDVKKLLSTFVITDSEQETLLDSILNFDIDPMVYACRIQIIINMYDI